MAEIGRHRRPGTAPAACGPAPGPARQKSPRPGMAPTHRGIGHKVVQRGHGSGHQQQLQRIKAPLHRSGQRLHQPARGRHHVRRSGHTHAQQQRPQGQHPPVNEQSLAQRTQALHTPDVVQGFVHGQRQLNDRNHQKPQGPPPPTGWLCWKTARCSPSAARQWLQESGFAPGQLCRFSCKRAKLGKAVNTANNTVKNGTMASSVV